MATGNAAESEDGVPGLKFKPGNLQLGDLGRDGVGGRRHERAHLGAGVHDRHPREFGHRQPLGSARTAGDLADASVDPAADVCLPFAFDAARVVE